MSTEYSSQGSPFHDARVRYSNAAGFQESFAEEVHLSHAVVVPAGESIVHIGGQLGWREAGLYPRALEDVPWQVFLNVEKSLVAAGVKDGWPVTHLGKDAWIEITVEAVLHLTSWMVVVDAD
ncbi:hypothetical protein BBP40_000203 [Aspergillus hancockii]|nr:hypothetical protein BBP40_000203 [Aspergillus hancockii]